MTRRLWIAYLAAPWGALIPIIAVGLLVLVVAAFSGRSREYLNLFEIMRVMPWQTWLWPVAASYAAGAVLLPLYFVFERRGWRGWRYYVPTALVAASLVLVVVPIVQFVWFVVASSHTAGSGIGAVSVGCAESIVETLGALACAAGCAGVFSLLTARRPN